MAPASATWSACRRCSFAATSACPGTASAWPWSTTWSTATAGNCAPAAAPSAARRAASTCPNRVPRHMDRIEAIERATLAAVPPQRLEEWGGWLLALDDGTVGRAHSAVPLRHGAPPEDVLGTLEARYREAGRRLVLRV